MESQLLWGVAAWRLIVAVILIVVGLSSRPILHRLARRLSRPVPDGSSPAPTNLLRPLVWMLMAGLLIGAVAVLQLPQLATAYMGNLWEVGLVAAAAFLVLGLIRLALRASETLDSDDERALKRLLIFFHVLVWGVAGVFVIDAAGYPLVDRIGMALDTVTLWDISVLRLVIAGALLLLGIWSQPVVRWGLRSALGSQRLATDSVWVRDMQELIPKPLSLITHAVLWYFVGQILLIPQQPINYHLWVTSALSILLVLAITFLAWRSLDVLSRAAERKALQTQSRLDDQLIPLARKFLKIAVAVLVGVVMVEKLGFPTTSLIASLSVGGLALALAAKDTVANLFGSIVVFTDQPFQVGDGIKVGGVEGVVEEVGLRSTRIRGLDRTMATVPNQQFTSAAVVNLSERPNRRISFEVGIGYDAKAKDMEDFLQALREWLKSKDGLKADTVVVHFTQFADSSLTVLVQAMTDAADLATAMALQEEMLLNVMRIVEAHGLEIAFPTRTVHLASSIEAPSSVATGA